jgi:hypothetical protein
MTSIGSILGGAFGLVRRHPLSVLVWGLLYVAAIALLLLAMRPLFSVYAELFSRQLAAGGKGPMNPQDLQPFMGRLQSAGGIVFLSEIGIFALVMILFTATQRAVLRPAERGLFYLRLGGDELRLIGLGLVLAVCFYIASFLAMLILVIPVAVVAVAGASPAAIGLIMLVETIVLTCAMIYFEVRLSLVFPLTFFRRSFVVGEGWRLSKGRFWTLFGAYFVIGLIYMVLASVLIGVAVAPFFIEMAQGPNTPEAFQSAAMHLMQGFLVLDARNVGLILGTALLGGLTLALFGGAMATAVRDLLAGDPALPDAAGGPPA